MKAPSLNSMVDRDEHKSTPVQTSGYFKSGGTIS